MKKVSVETTFDNVTSKQDKRIEALVTLVWHMESCTQCLTCMYNGWGEPLCMNGEKLYTAAKVPPKPERLPPGMGPCFKPGKILRGEGGRRPRVRTKIIAGAKLAKAKSKTKIVH